MQVLQTGRQKKKKLLRHAFPLSLYFKQRLLFCLEEQSEKSRKRGKFEKYILLCAKMKGSSTEQTTQTMHSTGVLEVLVRCQTKKTAQQ